jgi:protein ImuA
MNRITDTRLSALLASPHLWRGGAQATIAAVATGTAALDQALPGGGWPRGALTELLVDRPGIGELGLVLPWVARLTQAGGRAAFAGPPLIPYAPALVQAGVVLARLVVVRPADAGGTQWAAEQMLRSGCFGTVLAWPTQACNTDLRRLQLAAETGQAIALLFRDASCADTPSPAALRLRLARTPQGLDVHVLKCRGRAPGRIHLAARRP